MCKNMYRIKFKLHYSPADWCGNFGIYRKSTDIGTVMVLDELINLSFYPSVILPGRHI